MYKSSLSREKVALDSDGITSLDIAKAVKSLRETLGETQEGMARQLGVSLRGYVKWEREEAAPRGTQLLKLIALCPDAETRALFGLVSARPGLPGESSPFLKPKTPKDALRMRHFQMASQALEILYKRAYEGSEAADEKLRTVAGILSRWLPK